MLLHKSKYISLNFSQNGADALDRAIDDILQGDLKNAATNKFAQLVGIQMTPVSGDRFFLTVLAEGEPR